MTEVLQRAVSWQKIGVFSQYFVRIYSHLLTYIPNDLFEFIGVTEICICLNWKCGNAVRHCRTIERPCSKDSSDSRALTAQHGAATGSDGHAAVQGLVSHKLTTYFDPSVLSSHGRSGARSVGEGTGSGPVTRELLAGVWSALSLKSIDFHAPIYPWFMAVYADLFYTKSLITLELRGFGQFFSSKRPSVFERVGLLSLLAGRLRQGAGRSGDGRIDAFDYTTYF